MMRTFRTLLAVIALVLEATVAAGAATAKAAEGIQVIIVRDLTPGVKGFTFEDVARLGGHVDGSYGDHVVVTVSSEAEVSGLRGLAGVKYLQEVLAAGAPTQRHRELRATTERVRPRATIESASTFASRYDGSGNIYAIGTPGGLDTYEYDPLSRLKTATLKSIGANEVETYTYDPYGNLTQRSGTGAPGLIDVDPASNHLKSGAVYDEAGNLISWATETYTYDADNMPIQKSAPGREQDYVYDADGERIGVRNASSGDTWTWSFRGLDNHVLREYQSSNGFPTLAWSWVEDYIYRDGSLLATDRVPELGGRRDMHLDHLGTPRLITDSDGNIAVDRELRPFGSHTTTAAVTQDIGHGFDREEPMAFTGHERDYTSDPTMYTDYMHGREYTPQWGRFLSVDPVLDPRMALADPQSWNRYSYVRNNPLGASDPSGKCEIYMCPGPLDFINHQTFMLHLARAFSRAADNSSFGNLWHGAETGDKERVARGSVQLMHEALTLGFGAAESFSTESRTVNTAVSSESETLPLFRAVGTTEAADLARTGQFHASPNGTEFKGFFYSKEDAQDLANRLAQQTGKKYTVVSATASRTLVENSPQHVAVTEGPGVLIRNEDLGRVHPDD
jgi:RHS repeat-associated protein